MRCRKVTRKLSAFLDGEVGERQKERIASHLKTCPSCGEEVKTLSTLSVLLKEDEVSMKPPPYFWNKLEQKIIQAETNKNTFNTILEWLNHTLIPAGATAVMVIGLFIGTHLGGVIYSNIAQLLNPDNSSSVQQEMSQSLHLNSLNDFPQESIGDIYIGLLAKDNLP